MAQKIAFIPNDPLAGTKAPNLRKKAKRKNRPASRATFTLPKPPEEGLFDPGTPEFLFWQCREASLATLAAWEAFAGPHLNWQGNRKKLPIHPDAGDDLNAYYDRDSFSFFHYDIGTKTLFSGSSTDVVAHEVGHGLLDTIRPELWDATFLEAGAFHEAFGDCVALLTAFSDADTRRKLLANGTLKKKNFVESTAEELSDGIRRLQPDHNAAAPRRALNAFQYQLPSTLPFDGPPGALINEVHSFGMLFSGCIWELVAQIFASSAGKPADLLAAAKTTGKLLVEGSKVAPITSRFFQSVGRSMVLADDTLNGGKHRDYIKAAFQKHGILLGSSAMLAPTIALAGNAPSRTTPLHASTKKDLMKRLGADRLSAQPVTMFGQRVTRAVLHKEVELGSVHKALAGVVALVDVPVIVGGSGKQAAIVGQVPEPVATDEEVQLFVKSLVANDQIELPAAKKSNGAAKRAGAAAGRRKSNGANGYGLQRATHAVVNVKGAKVLKRIRFH
jgi:Fungalysin metallopeptidase (M36)